VPSAVIITNYLPFAALTKIAHCVSKLSDVWGVISGKLFRYFVKENRWILLAQIGGYCLLK
jgi:hypothetical protein